MPSEWGTGVGLEDQPSIDPGAESTPSASPAETVDSTAEAQKPKADQPAEKIPAQQQPAKDEFEEFGKTLTGRNAEKWNKLLADRKLARDESTQVRTALDEFSQRGVTSPADLDHLNSRIEELESVASSYTNAPTETVLSTIAQRDPAAWQRFSSNFLGAMYRTQAERFDREALQAKTDEDRAEAIARAQFLRGQADEIGRNAPQQTTDPRLSELNQREQQLQERQDTAWHGEIHQDIQGKIGEKIQPYIQNVKFVSPEQKAKFDEDVQLAVERAFAQRTNFLERMTRTAFGQDRTPQTKAAVAQEYANEIIRGGTLESIISRELSLLGLAAQSAEQTRQDVLAKANGRQELVGGGGVPGGAKTKDQVYQEIDAKYKPGSDDNIHHRQLWKLWDGS